MKKIIFLIFVLISYFISFGQYPNGTQYLGTDSNVVKARGGMQGRFININYTDTSAANLDRIRQYPGSQIYTSSDNLLWIRNSTAKAWIKMGQKFGIEDNLGLQNRRIAMQGFSMQVDSLEFVEFRSYPSSGSPSLMYMDSANIFLDVQGVTGADAIIDISKLTTGGDINITAQDILGSAHQGTIHVQPQLTTFYRVSNAALAPGKLYFPNMRDSFAIASPTHIAVWDADTLKSASATSLRGPVANGITLAGDTTILGDSLNRFTYTQVLSHLQDGTRFNHLRYGNLPESQSIGGTVPVYPYVQTYNPSTLSWDRLYSEQNHDTSYLQYGGALSGVTRFNFDSVGIYGASLPIPKEIVMPSQGVEALYQINLPRDTVRWAVGRDGQQANVFVGQMDWGQTWGYNVNTYAASNIPDMPISIYKANLDFQRNIDNQRRYKMTGVGVAQYLSAYKTYQTAINSSTYEVGDYVSKVMGFHAYGSMYPLLSVATKAKTLLVSKVDSSFGFVAEPQYRYTNDINNGYGFWMKGDSDYNHINGWLTVGPTLPTRENGGQLFRYKLNVTGKGHFTDSLISDGNIAGFVVKGQGMIVSINTGIGSEAGINYLQTDSAITGSTLAYVTASRDLRGFAIRSEGYSAANYPNDGTGMFVQIETGANHAFLTRWHRNGNMAVGYVNGVTTPYRLYKKLTVNGASAFLDTVTIKNIPIAPAGDTTNYFNLGINSNGDVFRVSYGSGGASGLTVGTTTITSGTNTKVLFNNSGVLGEYTISGSGNVAMTTSPTFTTPILGTPTSGTLTNTTGYLWNNIANPTGTQTLSWDDAELNSWTNGSNTETFHTVDNNSLTTGTSYKWNTSSMTTGNLLSINSTSTALAAGNKAVEIRVSGANGTNAITATGLDIAVTNTNATSGTNVGATFSASGATTDNIAANITGGRFQVRSNWSGLQPSLSVFTTVLGASNADTRTAIVSNNAAGNTLFLSNGLNAASGFYLGALTNDLVANNIGATQVMRLTNAGSVIIGTATTASARLTLPAGTTSASSAPVKFLSGSAMNTAEIGAMEYTTPQLFFTNGGLVRQELFQGQQSRVSTQFDKTDVTLANVTGLTANVAAGKTYRFEAILYTTSDVAGGVKAAIAGTATATNIIYEGFTIDAGATTQTRATALATAVGGVTAVTAAYIRITGTITVNAAGTLTVQFAENAAVNTSSVLVGSTFYVIEML